jgi:cyclophilin family peptidyl-prolyl cis-trans isomerase
MTSVRTLFKTLVAAPILLLASMSPVEATTVRLQTNVGAIDIALYDAAAPRTVANFLAYVNGGKYVNSFVHRSVPGFVIQGGGFAWNDAATGPVAITTFAPIANEFNVARSNKRGTIAMAKIGGDPNSATSQWFINLADNSSTLNVDNGGYTVFGEVTVGSMAVVDAIARLPLVNAGGVYSELPVVGTLANNTIQKSNVALVSAALAVPNSYQGLWWNANQSGWGMSLTQHGNLIFAAIYTYDAAGQPAWYVIPNCPLINSGCTGDIYRVTGGTSPLVAWNGSAKDVVKAGSGTLTFASTTAGNFDFTLNGVTASKAITLQPLATGTTPPAVDYTDLWWNESESGWGVSLTQQFGIIFAAWYTYDNTGKPVWYVVPNCPVVGSGCSGELYRVTGGAPITAAWTGTSPAVSVGSVTFTFTSATAGTMNYSLSGTMLSRAIVRQTY